LATSIIVVAGVPARPVIIITRTIRPVIIRPAIIMASVAAARPPMQELACITVIAIDADVF
jgi:hypothetical protein